MPTLSLAPFPGPIHATVTVPGSKSLTNRALVLAALKRNCTVTGALHSEDTEVMVESLRRLGFDVTEDRTTATIRVRTDSPAWIPAAHADLFIANSGTTVRFLTALTALGRGTYRLDGIARMRERPIADLLDALRELGTDAVSEAGTGCPPVCIRANGLRGGEVRLRGDVSSQFLSALLLVLPCADGDSRIELSTPLVSEPYVEMTLAMLRHEGIDVQTPTPGSYVIPGSRRLQPGTIEVEPDASSASYFFALPAILGGRVTVLGLTRTSLQGDVGFVDVLARMGCRVEACSQGITVHGKPIRGVDVDMNAISDTVMTLAAVACFADGPTTIRNVSHIRHKETDRLHAVAVELRRLGAAVTEHADGLTIVPQPLQGATVETYNDHRMAMSLALIGTRIPGVVIDNPGCVGKTYPEFFTDLEKLRPA